MVQALVWLGQQGRYCLIAGLLAGLALPGLAEALRPWIGTLVAVLLMVTGIRVGARAAFGSLDDIRPALVRIGLLQVALPLAAIAVFHGLGILSVPLALAVALMLSAPSVSGAPNFAAMAGLDPAPGMRLLVLGTAVFPLTVLPVLLLLNPTGGGAGEAVRLSLNLLLAILVSVGIGFGLRGALPALGKPRAQGALDGLAALLLAVAVVGLMSAIGPLLRTGPGTLALWMLAVLTINLTLLLTTTFAAIRLGADMPFATGVYAANRNIALFLIALPAEAAAPLMVFIGCYQVPMYLTPLVLTRLRRAYPV